MQDSASVCVYICVCTNTYAYTICTMQRRLTHVQSSAKNLSSYLNLPAFQWRWNQTTNRIQPLKCISSSIFVDCEKANALPQLENPMTPVALECPSNGSGKTVPRTARDRSEDCCAMVFAQATALRYWK